MKERKEGFTLLETLIAMVIFVLVMSLFCSLLTVGGNITKLSNNMTNKHNQAATVLAGTTVSSVSEVIVTGSQMIINFPSVTSISIGGSYHTVDIDGVKYKYFKPQ
ncbi:MAG: type IV pilus modification PilV family protein [Cellulosilyticaceae bacterium]